MTRNSILPCNPLEDAASQEVATYTDEELCNCFFYAMEMHISGHYPHDTDFSRFVTKMRFAKADEDGMSNLLTCESMLLREMARRWYNSLDFSEQE